jgi:two-component system phosphate regulon sensor histidine kinase PhoR
MITLAVILGLLLALALLAWRRERSARAGAESEHREEIGRQRERRETELREQARRTGALFDRMVEGVVVLDAGGSVRHANRAAGELFGFTPPATGRALLEVIRHHEVAALAARLAKEPEVLEHELRFEGSGPPRFFQINALALRDGQGRHDGALLVFHEVTRLRQLEALRQEFVANVSHELRTPLSLIKGAVETLLDGAKDDPGALSRFLGIIDRHADRLTLLINDLLLLSTLESGRVRLALQPVALRGIVQEVMDDFLGRAQARSVTLANDVPPGLVVSADPERLRQVIANLVDNAIKYGRADGRAAAGARSLGDGRVEMSVSDDGQGIPLDAQARIFERFYRVDKARSRDQGGTGLGLAIVKHVVQSHGGEVRVESSPGRGTTFFITLPQPG